MATPAETIQPGWAYAVAGIVAILFGLVAILWPHLTLALLVLFFGAFAIVSGIVYLIEMFRRMGRHETWWPALIVGVISIIAGLYVLTNPFISGVILLWVIAFWAILIGIIEIVGAISTAQFLLLIVGVLTVGFGFILLANPVAGALALVLVIGVFAIVRGIILLLEAFRPATTPAFPAS